MEPTPRTTTRQEALTCPACGATIMMEVLWEVVLDGAAKDGTVTAHLKPQGVRIEHGCMPRATR